MSRNLIESPVVDNVAPKYVSPFDAPSFLSEVEARQRNLVRRSLFRAGQATIDKAIAGQRYAIVAMVPCPNAKPDEDGYYGFAKVRGVYDTIEECEEKAVQIVQTQDQLLENTIVAVGHPFPFTLKRNTQLDQQLAVNPQAIVPNNGNNNNNTKLGECYKSFARQKTAKERQAQKEMDEKREQLMSEAALGVEDEAEPTVDMYAKRVLGLCQLIEMSKQLLASVSKNEKRLRELIASLDSYDQIDASLQHTYFDMIQAHDKRSGFCEPTTPAHVIERRYASLKNARADARSFLAILQPHAALFESVRELVVDDKQRPALELDAQ